MRGSIVENDARAYRSSSLVFDIVGRSFVVEDPPIGIRSRRNGPNGSVRRSRTGTGNSGTSDYSSGDVQFCLWSSYADSHVTIVKNRGRNKSRAVPFGQIVRKDRANLWIRLIQIIRSDFPVLRSGAPKYL